MSSEETLATRSPTRSDKAVRLVGFMLVLVGAVFATVMSILGRSALPERFTRDDRQIRLYMLDVPPQLRSTSYGQTAAFYNNLGMSSHEWLRTISAASMLLLILWKCRVAHSDSLWAYVSLFVTLVLSGIYILPVYSKDFFVLPLVVTFVLLTDSLIGEAFWVGLALEYGNLIRANWVAVAVLYIVFRLILRRRTTIRFAVLQIVALVLILAVAFQVLYGRDLHYYRYSQTNGLLPDVASIINDPLPSGNLFFTWCNGVYSLATFLFPLPLALLLSPFYIAVSVFIAVNWWRTFRMVLPILNCPRMLNDNRTWRTLALLMSVTVVQSFYAPDWGSYTRHLTPFLPLFAIIIAKGRDNPQPSSEPYRVRGQPSLSATASQFTIDR